MIGYKKKIEIEIGECNIDDYFYKIELKIKNNY